MNLQQAFDAGFDAVKAYVDCTVNELDRRIALLEARLPEKGDPGERGLQGAEGFPGRDGRDGAPGRDGINGKDGANGADGKDGAAGLNGKDGRDGIGYDGMNEFTEDGGRFLVRQYFLGELLVNEFRHTMATQIYRGVYVEAQNYLRGDEVTWAGSQWHCNAETSDKPGDGSKVWTLAVKKGRDGRDGGTGPKGDPGPKGEPGRDRR